MTNIMIDIETLDTKESAVVLSIGAYCLETKQKFYVVLTTKDQYTQKLRTISLDTTKWWLQQSEDAREVFKAPCSYEPDRALSLLYDYVDFNKGDTFWCKSTTFDFPILEHLATQYGAQAPWNFRQLRDFRTALKMFPGLVFPFGQDETAHNAVGDAVNQGMQLEFIQQFIASMQMPQPIKE